ncbi:obg-like ATPase 1 [Schistosoma bovis]|uniref:Obg-like ATPase 1 n=1 Tax=Schistosoma bovis TaxID=6184 RepID=A0A430QLJ5_SCHBO|nr:obg-like ATPase 1 [Schistosoma bovis]
MWCSWPPERWFRKSTFFNILTKSQVPAENFPFCTINPNESRVAVPDERFDWLCEYHQPVSRVPAYLNVVDIAGLVKGAHEGQGLGNAFLSHIRSVDAIFHMLRLFENEDITHIEGDIDPVRDLDIIDEELRLKDIEYVTKEWEKCEKVVIRGNDKKQMPAYECLTKVKNMLVNDKRNVRFGDWTPTEIYVSYFGKYFFLHKIANGITWLSKSRLPKIKEWVDEHDSGAAIIPFSADLEQKLSEMSPEEAGAYMKENEFTTMLPKIIRIGYQTLQLQYFFTCGKDEVKAWTIQAAGKYKQKGREYIVEDGDIILFKFNAGAGLQAKKK